MMSKRKSVVTRLRHVELVKTSLALKSGMFISFQSMNSHFVARFNFANATFDMTATC